MDLASRTIFSLNNGILTFIAQVFNDPTLAIALVLIFFLLFVWRKTDRASPIFVSLILVFLLIDPLKAFLNVSRPCLELAAKVPCPVDASMPSGHAVVSGIFLLASVATPFFPIVLPLSLFVSFSRVYLGIHTIADVAGGIAVGAAIYSLCDKAFAKYRRAVL
jgi:membrane-associated phospholipid phosphatase